MTLFEQLEQNKGTISSALGKELAKKVLNGNTEILSEAINYTSFDPHNKKAKSIRAGAAKIIEKVAEKKPELVAPYLGRLLPALDMPEPQTRWMIILAFGYCVKDKPKLALKGIDFAKSYIEKNQGVCLTGAAHVYLGHAGAYSPKEAKKVLPVLLDALQNASVNEVDWIIEAFVMICDKLSKHDKEVILNYAKIHLDPPKKSTVKRIEKLMKKIDTAKKMKNGDN